MPPQHPPCPNRRRNNGRPRRVIPLLSASEFEKLSVNLLRSTYGSKSTYRRFNNTFGITPRQVSVLWRNIARKGFLEDLGPKSVKPIHLLWSLMFLRRYTGEESDAQRAGCCETTFRNWAWFYIECIAGLDSHFVRTVHCGFVCYFSKITLTNRRTSPIFAWLSHQVQWKNRFKGNHRNNRSLVTVDGTDFRIGEPAPFSTCWYAKKFNTAGLRYELAVCIATGDIVSFNGPFAPKGNPDINIFRYKLKGMLAPGEQVLTDQGYRGDTRCCTTLDAKNQHHRTAMSHARCRHETINRRLKQWKALSCRFRHHRTKHHFVFRAVMVLTQLAFENGNRPWQLTELTYSDPIYY